MTMGWKSWINPRVSCFINGFEEGLVSEWGWGFHEFVELFEATKNRWDFCVLWFPSNRILPIKQMGDIAGWQTETCC